jgi:TfoX/Sxy family transcriptional regulator of competence genes
MAYSEDLADRVRQALAGVSNVREQQMFGGLAFMVDGNMALGIVRDELMARLGEEGADRALDELHVRPMDFTGRPMRKIVLVEPAGTAGDDQLAGWVARALEFVATLPPKA